MMEHSCRLCAKAGQLDRKLFTLLSFLSASIEEHNRQTDR